MHRRSLRTVPRFRGILPGLVALALIAGCSDSTDPGPPCADPEGGLFIGQASGAANNSLRGCTSYAVTSSGGSPNTVLLVSVGPLNAPTTTVSLVRAGDRPAVGLYQIGFNPGNFSGSILRNGSSFNVTSGSVTIDAVLTGELQGSFSATGVQSGSGASITVSGTFQAVCTAAGSITC